MSIAWHCRALQLLSVIDTGVHCGRLVVSYYRWTEEEDYIIMSAALEAAADDEMCASCGKVAVDDMKLKKCACNLVKYCSTNCQKNHRPQHKKTCKQRLAEIRDDKLFTQPDGNHYGECPICCLPLPIGMKKWILNSCCSKSICHGCNYANKKREAEEGLDPRCPYCRESIPTSLEEIEKNNVERAKANDPGALCQLGFKSILRGDGDAFHYYTKAAALGEADAHWNLSIMYHIGGSVERDMKKRVYHLEEAAIGGHPVARYNLGCTEGGNGRYDRAVKHFIITAKLGFDEALEEMKKYFLKGLASKEDYEAALRGHQAAVDAAKSTQREEAEKAMDGSRKG